MYSLIRFFGEDRLYIYRTKAVIEKNGKKICKWKGAHYEVNIIRSSDNEEDLKNPLYGTKNIGERDRSSGDRCKDSDNSSETDPYATDEDEEYFPDSDSCEEADLLVPEDDSSSQLFNETFVTTQDYNIQPTSTTGVDQNIPDDPNKNKRVAKKHYCLYCQCKLTNLPRHLERKHSNEDLVQEALKFKAGSKERIKYFTNIRKKGDFIAYKHESRNMVTVGKSNKMAGTTFIPCPHCKGFYSKKNLKNHVRLVCDPRKIYKRNILSHSKVLLATIHPAASKELKENIFPAMRNDDVFYVATTDPTIILYGNMLVLKYSTSMHHNKMITQQLRHISNIFLTIKKLNPIIQNVENMLDPKFYNDMVETIHQLAGLSNGKYKSPSVANHSCTLLTHLIHFVKCESIKKNDSDLRKRLEDYAYLMQHSQNALITKIAGENRTQHQRAKTEILPTTDDINKLISLLDENIQKNFIILSEQFEFKIWCTLNELVLIDIMIFNRKRPGDVEKTRIIEYKNIKTINKNELDKLPVEERQLANFGRYISRGKLNRPAPTLVSKQNMEAIELLLRHRENAGIKEDNEYLFADTKVKQCKHIKADIALKSFLKQYGLSDSKYTATKLRKHLATATSSLSQGDQHLISDFMGHAFDIHNNIYKQRQAESDILKMGKLLVQASGSTLDNKTADLTPVYVENIQNLSEPTPANLTLNILPTNINTDLSTIEEETNNTSQELIINKESSTSQQIIVNKRKTRAKVVPPSVLRKSRRTWRTPERRLLKDVFNEYIYQKKLPTLHECQNLIYENPNVLYRSPRQVRSWIGAEIKRREKYGPNNSPGWSTPVKQACRRYFKSYYDEQQYPSLAELLIAQDQVPELADKSPDVIRSHLQHDFKYLKTVK